MVTPAAGGPPFLPAVRHIQTPALRNDDRRPTARRLAQATDGAGRRGRWRSTAAESTSIAVTGYDTAIPTRRAKSSRLGLARPHGTAPALDISAVGKESGGTAAFLGRPVAM
jgi:hypothetical protein